jgi:hypothetical protein
VNARIPESITADELAEVFADGFPFDAAAASPDAAATQVFARVARNRPRRIVADLMELTTGQLRDAIASMHPDLRRALARAIREDPET